MNLLHKKGTGISSEQFIAGMTKNKEQFVSWQKQFAWPSDEDRAFFAKWLTEDREVSCFILMAEWCGDVVRNIPVVLHILEQCGIDPEILVMEQHLETMDQFLTFGGRSIPVVIFTDKNGNVLGQWGPRPAYIQEPMAKFKQHNTDREAADYEANLKDTRNEILRRYGEGTEYQALIVTEMRQLLERM